MILLFRVIPVFSVIGYRDVQSIFRASTADRFRFKLRITFKL
jgi:hypothetical protein